MSTPAESGHPPRRSLHARADAFVPPLRPSNLPAHPLATWVRPLFARVRREELDWFTPQVAGLGLTATAEAVVQAIQAARRERGGFEERAELLKAQHDQARTEVERREVLARYLRVNAVPGNARGLRRDLRALRDTLDLGAVLEREALEVERWGARIEVGAELLAGLVSEVCATDPQEAGRLLDETVGWLLADLLGDVRKPTRRTAARALAEAGATVLDAKGGLSSERLAPLQAAVTDQDEDIWVRRAALGLALGLDAPTAQRWIQYGLEPRGVDAALLRARAVEIALRRPEAWGRTMPMGLLEDPAEVVRFAYVEGLAARSEWDPIAPSDLAQVCEGARDARTRALAACRLGEAAARHAHIPLSGLVTAVLDEALVAGFALEGVLAVVRSGRQLTETLRETLILLIGSDSPPIARLAALALSTEHGAQSSVRGLAAEIAGLRLGEVGTVTLPEDMEVGELAQALVPHAAEGFGFAIDVGRSGGQSRLRISRGDAMEMTNWRVIHEIRNPGPVKRQTISHTTGRADTGSVRIPPSRLAEESPTGVPGQRLVVEREGGWAPVVPMVDDFLHAARRGRVTVVSAEGVTEIEGPSTWMGRMRARSAITTRYRALDASRTASLAEEDPQLRRRFVAAFEELGFTVKSSAVGVFSRYFDSGFRILDPVAFVLSMRSNTIVHVAWVVAFFAALLVARQIQVRLQVNAARRKIPLVVGGWGTRGKSGSERLKAAVLEGLGIPYLSKTTGCEAMLLHGPPGGHALELFLFRPFDKATIWEQADCISLAPQLGARAFLWECMALNPVYVDMLQRFWMKDDLSTLTNAYPDHEDIQGPSGMDVAEVLGVFAPPGATLVTTEANMLPVLEEQALKRGSSIMAIGRADRELVARELMDRMPHVEHPANVALATAFAAALGVPPVEAVGLMGEHVVPDLGALTITPTASTEDREVVFVNGMSANDLLSFRHNWRRGGFADHDVVRDPGTFLVTVVNNRDDRAARSRTFAGVLATEGAAHRHVLIGTNLAGLRRMVDDAVNERLRATSLEDGDRVEALFRHLKIVHPVLLAGACGKRLGLGETTGIRAALTDLELPEPTWPDAQHRAESLRPAFTAFAESHTDLVDHLVAAAARWLALQACLSARPAAAFTVYREIVRASLITVDDPGASADQVIAAAVHAAPPGTNVRIIGVQNIKGTGLAFAYEWVHFRRLCVLIRNLSSRDGDARRDALDAIEGHPMASVIAYDTAIGALQTVTDPRLIERVTAITARFRAERERLMSIRDIRRGSWFMSPLQAALGLLERFLDPFDSLLRRWAADKVFRDLAAMRISHVRASQKLAELTERQKGGWLGGWKQAGKD